ncbi:peptide deformylase [Flavobacteriaceae bacterium GSB9]|nr:peptide deformylase [Flavobacteriaceae bacterium GSB9]
MKNFVFLTTVLLVIASCSSTKNISNHGFTSKETKLILNANSLKPMRVYRITNKTDSILLRSKSSHIKPNPKDVVLRRFVNRLYATVTDSKSLGVGIAAPQVGILKNIIWVQRFDKENFPFEVYLNPEIMEYSKNKQTVREGCLSIPNRSDTLNCRSFQIRIEYDTMAGQHKTETVESFTSVIFQHEIDHLNGILYLDHLKKERNNTKN